MTRKRTDRITKRNRTRFQRRRRLICESLEDRRLLAVVFSEGFETDGNGTRYTTANEFTSGPFDYYTRINDTNGDTAGGETPAIDLDGALDEYTGFTGQWYFAAEDVNDVSRPDFRTIDFDPISTSSFENMVFSGDFAAGDTDSGPSYDTNHFLAVLYSTDAGSTYIPGLVFRPRVTAADVTNFELARVNVVAPGSSLSTLAQLGAQLSTGVIATDTSTPGSQFNFIAADTDGTGAAGTALTQDLDPFTFNIPNAASVRLRLVLDMDDNQAEVAFDNFAINGDPVLTNVAPSVSASSAPDVTQSDIGQTTYSFTVTYADDVAIDVSDIATSNVTVTGPAGVTIATANEPTGTDGTPKTATYTFTPPGGSWDGADDGVYTVNMVAGQVSDTDGTPLFVPAGVITTFNVNATNEAPVVTDALAEDVIFQNLGDTSYTFTVEYTDTFHDVDVSTIDVTDVTVSKGGGGTLTVTGVTTAPLIDGSPVTATYTVTPAGGSWDAGDDDTYTIALNASAVQDVVGDSAAADPSLATFVVNSNKVLNEGFETDGNGTRYTTSGEFSSGVHDYWTRVFDNNGNAAGGETPLIDLDDATLDEYIDFDRRVYFAAEDVDAGGGGGSFRVLDIDPINTAAFTGLSFMGSFGAGDNTDGGPGYDGDHFMAVLVSTDSGATYIPKLVFRADITGSDNTNFQAKRVITITPGSDPSSDTLAELGAKLSDGQIMANAATGSNGGFEFMGPEGDGTGANGTTLGANLQSFSVGLDDAAETRVRVVVMSDSQNIEWAFDNLMITGTFTGVNQAPTALAANAPNVGETEIGDTTYSFTVTYADDSGIDFTTIDTSDVTVTGPGGTVPITLASVDIASNGTPRVGTYTFTPPGGSWDAADNGLYTIGIVGNEVGDDDSTQLFVVADANFTTFNVNATNTDPVVNNFLAEDVIFTDFGETSYSFTVEYTDVGGIDVSSIGLGDVTVTGPGGLLAVTSGVETSGTDGSPKTGTYTVTPPGGSWDAGDIGTYTIGVVGNEILDILGASVATNPALTSFDVIPSKLLNETFETDGNGTRYTTSGEFVGTGYYTRVTDINGNAAGGDTPDITLDDLTLSEYIDFQGQTYFAAEEVDNVGTLDGFRVLDIDPIDTSAFTNLQFMGLFGAGDNTDGNPAYDGDHFMAVLVSTDGGANYTPRIVFRSDVTAGDSTGFVARQVNVIAPGTDPTSDTLEELGAKLSAGQIMPNPAIGGADGQFDFMAAEGSGTGADGTLLGANLQTASVGLSNAAETRIRLVLQSDSINVEWAFDSLMLTGDVADADPPVLQSFTRQTPPTSPTDADTLVFRATFNEDVTAIGTDDFAVNGTTTSTVTAVTPVSGSTYDITVSGGDLANFNGTVGLDLSGTQDITDLVGNPLPNTEPGTDETYSVVNTTADLSVTTQGDENGPVDAVFTVTLGNVNNTGSAITFDLDDLLTGSASSGNDYTAIPASATISVADGQSTGSLTVDVTDDGLLEATESIDAQISNPSIVGVTINTSTATANITDNDTATADLSVTTQGDENGPIDAVFTVTLSLTNDTGSAITFDLDDLLTGSASSGSDYTAISGSATISVADGQNTGTLTVDVTDDGLLEATETIDAQVSNPSNPAVTVNTGTASANISDDETATADLSVTTNGDETGPVDIVFTVTLSLTNDTGSAITFDLDDLLTGAATSGSDYTAIPASATISVADGQNTGTLTVPVIDDTDVEGSEDLDAQISNSSNPAVTINTSTAEATITDNDAAIGNFVFVDSNADGDQTSEVGLDGVTVNLLNAAGNTQLQSTTTAGGGLYNFTVAPGTYIVEFVKPANSSFSPRDAVADNIDSDADTVTGRTGQITVVAGQTDDTNDAGLREFAPTLSFANVISLPEGTDTTNPIKVADVVINDPDGGPNVLTLGGGADDAFFTLVGTELFLNAQTLLDFETKPTYSTVVSVNDPGIAPTPNDTQPFTLNITDVNEPPVVQALHRLNQILESTILNNSVRVADINVVDDALGTAALSVTGVDAVFFEFQSGNTELHLKAGTQLDFETKPFFNVTVEADDATIPGSPDSTVAVQLQVLDVFEPPEVNVVVNAVNIPDQGIVNFGDHAVAGPPPTRTLIVENNGFEDLVIQPAALPAGFTLVGPNFAPNTVVAPGANTSITVEMDTSTAGVPTGILTFGNNDPNESNYRITLSGAVLLATTNPTIVPGGLIIDNGDVGFFDSGGWNNVTGFGFDNDALAAVGTDGARRAIWAYGNLTPGQFDVSLTWLFGSDRANNVPVVIRDGIGGPVLSSLTLDQRVSPVGPIINGRKFEILDRVNLGSDTLVVELSNLGAPQAVIADAVLITPFTPPPATPEITVKSGGNEVTDGSSLTLPTVTVGGPGNNTIVVRNDGTADLILQPVSVTGPAFSIGPNFAPNTIVPAGGQATFGLNVDTSTAGIFNGTLLMNNNDGDENPFDLQLAITVRDPAAPTVLIDDGDPDFALTGNWVNVPNFGHAADAKIITNVQRGTATWTFTGLAAGDYNVSTTWLHGNDRAPSVPYVIRDGVAGPILATAPIDQRVAPSGSLIGGRPFTRLGTVTLAGTELVVEVDNSGAAGHVVADAVRIELVVPAPNTPEIEVTDGGLTVLDGGSVSFGSADQGDPAISKTFTVENTGTADIILEPLSLTGTGFSLGSPNFTPGQVLPPAATADFTVELATANVGTFSGNVTFANNDADENPFNFDISGNINAVQPAGVKIIDNGDSGFSADVGFANVAGFGFGADALAGNGINGVETAQWVFDGLTAGTSHEVSTTWLRGGDREATVTYVIRDGVGGAILANVVVDQTQNPTGGVVEGGRPFQVLSTVTISGTELVVELSTLGSTKAVIADAVRIEQQ